VLRDSWQTEARGRKMDEESAEPSESCQRRSVQSGARRKRAERKEGGSLGTWGGKGSKAGYVGWGG